MPRKFHKWCRVASTLQMAFHICTIPEDACVLTHVANQKHTDAFAKDAFAVAVGVITMRCKIIINTVSMNDGLDTMHRVAEVFNGEIDIKPEDEYLTKISIIAEGIEHPICDVPFSPLSGYWKWISPEVMEERKETD